MRNTLRSFQLSPFSGFVLILVTLSLLSSLRNIFLPLVGDEITYARIAESIILQGQYHLDDKPTAITPIVPFFIALFYTPINPALGLMAAKFFNLIFVFFGFRFCFLFLKKLNLDLRIISLVLLLTVVNNNFILWILRLYPEAMIFCFFWGFLYYLIKDRTSKELILSFIFLVLLVLTRYVYAILGILFLYKLYNFFLKEVKSKEYGNIGKTLILLIIATVPLIFWGKYIFLVEKEIQTSISYFKRFSELGLLHNIKAGLGIVKHAEAGQLNGIPAFISLIVPMHGLRSWILSLILVISFSAGLFIKWKDHSIRILGAAVFLLLGGLVLSGTGFSRYWLPLLPAFWVGFYLCYKSFRFNDIYFITFTKALALAYVINEIRLDILVFNNLS